jgi:hypothetical protein
MKPALVLGDQRARHADQGLSALALPDRHAVLALQRKPMGER